MKNTICAMALSLAAISCYSSARDKKVGTVTAVYNQRIQRIDGDKCQLYADIENNKRYDPGTDKITEESVSCKKYGIKTDN